MREIPVERVEQSSGWLVAAVPVRSTAEGQQEQEWLVVEEESCGGRGVTLTLAGRTVVVNPVQCKILASVLVETSRRKR